MYKYNLRISVALYCYQSQIGILKHGLEKRKMFLYSTVMIEGVLE